MAIALVSNIGTGGTANGVTSSSFDSTGANLLVVGLGMYQATPLVGDISDDKSNTWNILTLSTNGANGRCVLYYSIPTTVGTGHTVTFSKTFSYPSMCVAAFSGAHTSPFDQESASTTSSSSMTRQPGSITPTENNSLIISVGSGYQNTLEPSINSSMTKTDWVAYLGGNRMAASLAYYIQPTAAAINPTWTWNSSTTVTASIASFKPAAAAAGITQLLDGGMLRGGFQSMSGGL